MAGNSTGKVFRITTFGESHGAAIGVVVDGCPAGLSFDHVFLEFELSRRRPGQSTYTTPRNETDAPQVLSGVFENITTGAPIAILMANNNQRPADYDHLKDVWRPSHADYTYQTKYGHRDYRGGGRASARETAARVAAGAVAKMLLRTVGITVEGYVSQIGHVCVPDDAVFDYHDAEANPLRCPYAPTAAQMVDLLEHTRAAGDSLGGVVVCRALNCPAGMGEPVFDKLHADLAKAVMSINACKGFEIGSGFEAAGMRGSAHNDAFVQSGNVVSTLSNHSGGIQGGISNGMPLLIRAAFKPVATVALPQQTLTSTGEPTSLTAHGRHDPCVVPRAVPIVEAMVAITLADHLLRMRLNKI
jgi:chorismate synthase